MSHSQLIKLSRKLEDNDSFIWTDDDVAGLLRNNSNYIMDGYKLKNASLFWELTFLLNEGYLKCTVQEFEVPYYKHNKDIISYESYLEFKETLNEIEMEILEQIENTTSYINDIFIKYSIWQLLNKQGTKEIEFKKRNYAMYAKDLQIMVQQGDVSIQHLYKSFIKGLETFIIIPYSNSNKAEMFVLSRTNKLSDYFYKKDKRDSAEKKLFKQIKNNHTKSILPAYNGVDLLETNDLVEFHFEGEVLRGIVVNNMPSGKAGIDLAYNELDREDDFQSRQLINNRRRLEDILGINRNKIIPMFDEQGYSEPRVLIKYSKKTSKGNNLQFYAIKKDNIITCVPFDEEMIIDTIKRTFYRSNNYGLCLEFIQEDSLTSNAAYEPNEHKIMVSLVNTFNFIIQNFLDEGLHLKDSTEILIAHELGHADQRSSYLFDGNYNKTIDRINQLEKQLVRNWQGIINKTVEVEVLEQAVKILQEEIPLLEKYSEMELSGERDAFIHGLDYISEHLKWEFQKENYKTYSGYKSRNEKRILERRKNLYTILSMLPGYTKREEEPFLKELSEMFGFN